jgi:hypothetical protein
VTRVWIWRRLTHNIGWKLASLTLSILLWFAVVGEPELVTIQSVPVLFRNLPASLLLVSDAPSEVRAELRGPSGRLTRDTLSEVFAAVDLAGVDGPGVQTFTLSKTVFSLPQGVSFQRAVPSQVSLHFERTGSKAVPVEIKFMGALPGGYRLAAKTVQPATLTVSGPETNVAEIQFAQTDPVDLSGVTQTTAVKVNAFVDDKRVQLQSQPVVTVWLTIEKTEEVP